MHEYNPIQCIKTGTDISFFPDHKATRTLKSNICIYFPYMCSFHICIFNVITCIMKTIYLYIYLFLY